MDIGVYKKLIDVEGIVTAPNRMVIPVGKPVKLDIPCYDGQNQPVHPSVVLIPSKLNGYRYWMAMTPYTNGAAAVENPSIVASNDGVIWVVPSGLTNPVVPALTSPAFNRDAELIYVPGEGLRMYWGDSLGKAYYKVSADGVNWSESISVTGGVFSSSQATIIRKSANDWEAWAQPVGFAEDPIKSGNLSRYTSKDGVAWTQSNPAVTNLKSKIWHVGVLNDAIGYHYLACAYPNGRNIDLMDLAYGYSENGVDIVFDSTPVLQTELEGWYNSKIYKSCMIPFANQMYRIYFSYRGLTGGKWGIGYLDVKLNTPSRLIQSLYTPRKESFERTIFDKFQIRQTGVLYYGGSASPVVIPEFHMYENKVLLIRNTHDQPITLTISNMLRGSNLWDGIGKDINPRITQSITIPTGSGTCYIDKSILQALGVMLPGCTSIRVTSTLAPTTGDISVSMMSY